MTFDQLKGGELFSFAGVNFIKVMEESSYYNAVVDGSSSMASCFAGSEDVGEPLPTFASLAEGDVFTIKALSGAFIKCETSSSLYNAVALYRDSAYYNFMQSQAVTLVKKVAVEEEE
ncbi:hypothetical protein PM1_002 [Pectobacterium phage PM1]|uniref:Uncharacterized protein n=1 Tax=Pectobacterium phage PM1 TaxID=1399915 RepID=X2CST6_9CAUD|nr:hypothetical protein PM1_002 [Pectobacterium phage PM1]AGV99218.1 hypothetical protein PM1_002 [Pectobacterium phage PM1]